MKNFREVMCGIDPRPLLDQVLAHPELWNIDESWTKDKGPECDIYAVENIILRYPKPHDPPNIWDRPAFRILSEAVPIIFDLMRAIRGERLGKVVISRMRPGEVIKPHVDEMPLLNPFAPWRGRHQVVYQRYQIPLLGLPGTWFNCGDERLYMQPGTAWWFDNGARQTLENGPFHSVVNDSPDYRISMLTDIRPWNPPAA